MPATTFAALILIVIGAAGLTIALATASGTLGIVGAAALIAAAVLRIAQRRASLS